MKRLLSLAHLTVLDADPLTLVDAGAAAGCDAIGLRIVPPMPGDRIVPVVGDLALQRRIRERLDATGLRILDVEAIWLLPETDVAGLEPALDTAKALGARYVLVSGNDPERNHLIANFGRLCEAAHARGLRIMFEFIPYSQVRSLAEAHRLLAEVKPADAGIVVDALHLTRSGGSAADIAAYDPALFSYVQVCDAAATAPPPDGLRAEARGGRLCPGDGALDLRALMAALPDGIPAAIEAPTREHAHLPPIERAKLAVAAWRRQFKD